MRGVWWRCWWWVGWMWSVSLLPCLGLPVTPTSLRTPINLNSTLSHLSGVQGDNGKNSASANSLTPSSISIDNAIEEDPCEPESLQMLLRQEPQHATFDYKVIMKHPSQHEANCDRPITWQDCSNTRRWGYLPLTEGSFCIPQKGFYKLTYLGKESHCHHLNGLYMRHEELTFESDSVAKVKFQPLPSWAKDLKVKVVDVTGRICGKVTTQDTTVVIVPGNYTKDKWYKLSYLPVLREEVFGDCNSMNGYQPDRMRYLYSADKPRPDPSPNNYSMIAGVIFGVSALLMGIVCINYCHHTKRGARRRPSTNSTLPLLSQTEDGDKGDGKVLLLHAEDSDHLAQLCRGLKAEVIKCCGKQARQVLDVTQLDDQTLISPQAWAMKVLCDPANKVIVVLSPALVALHRAIKENNNDAASACLTLAEERGVIYHWDVLLAYCLNHLEHHLCKDYSRLFVVKFKQMNIEEYEDIPELVTLKRFLLPEHYQDLHRGLRGNQCQV